MLTKAAYKLQRAVPFHLSSSPPPAEAPSSIQPMNMKFIAVVSALVASAVAQGVQIYAPSSGSTIGTGDLLVTVASPVRSL